MFDKFSLLNVVSAAVTIDRLTSWTKFYGLFLFVCYLRVYLKCLRLI